MKNLLLIICLLLIAGCTEETVKPKPVIKVATKTEVALVPLNPLTSTCEDISNRKINSEMRSLQSKIQTLSYEKSSVKDKYEKTSDFELRKAREKAETAKKLKVEFENMGTDGLLQYQIEDKQKYNADKDLLTITTAWPWMKTRGDSYSVKFMNQESSKDSEPMKGYHVTHIATHSSSAIFENATSIGRKIKNGNFSFSINAKPEQAKTMKLSLAFAGYPITPYFKTKSQSISHTLNLTQTDLDTTIYLHLRCLFLIDTKNGKTIQTIEF